LIFSLQLIFVYCFHIHFGYVLILTWPKIGGWKMSIIIFKNVQWKVTYRKRNLKKKIIYSDYLLKNIQKLSKLRKKNLAPLFCHFLSWNRVRERSNIYISLR
jgi:hypothetical protein